jgi:hypothetical protein
VSEVDAMGRRRERDGANNAIRAWIDSRDRPIVAVRNPHGASSDRNRKRTIADRDAADDSSRLGIDAYELLRPERGHPNGAGTGRDPERPTRQLDRLDLA